MIKMRELSNLGDDDAATALERIELLFGRTYLEQNKSHRLPILWSRQDRLATVELYTLGKCLEKFTTDNMQWLKDTIKRIKKEPADKTHGLFTEIVCFGMFGLHHSKLQPAKGKNPGYDFSLTLPNGTKQFISVKNIDISDSQKEFQANCRRLRTRWQERLRVSRSNLGMRVVSSKSLSTSDFDLLSKAIYSLPNPLVGCSYMVNEQIHLHVHALPYSPDKLSPKHISDMMVVYCPGPESERTRYRKKLRDAVNNISRYTHADEKTTRVVFMRMHVCADYTYIVDHAQSFINDPSEQVDCIICYQPSYVRDSLNNSLLHHCFKFEASARFAMQMGGSDYYRLMPPLGSISQSQAPVRITDKNTGIHTDIASSDYLFQKGDIYQLAQPDKSGALYADIDSPAPGIRTHGVMHIHGDYVTLSSKVTPISEELLIV